MNSAAVRPPTVTNSTDFATRVVVNTDWNSTESNHSLSVQIPARLRKAVTIAPMMMATVMNAR